MRAALFSVPGALWRSSHPGPTLVVTVLAVILGISAGLDAGRLALLAAAVFAGQLCVGWSNDAVDARRDTAVGRADKPIARGEISARGVWAAAVVAVVVTLVLSALLGWPFLVVHLITLVSAWSYNVALKRTAFSVAPFVVSFGLFPSLATLAAPAPGFAAPWAWIAGAALGAAVHFSNVLPDLDDDAATGVRGLPHRLGSAASAVTAFVAVEVGALAVLIGPIVVAGSVPPLGIVAFGLVSVLAAVGLARALRRPDRTVFRLVMGAALLLALQLAVTGVSVQS
ncbi:UbiA family prenyltransferase [Microbacterium telephonicum]|uniref:4-hydroxybenzoate polyprenyltransferase n=1 Tax=Microbacterium telephonicum TaxID=1714841 RepID=A0A498BUJ4_9MICO|nr:UbiA family prenyltransferase [Microbacterium telephonicum]RLK46607.1 4-hydroxybenzoate polyprenyltransferase [Microbacterium telephonicum]